MTLDAIESRWFAVYTKHKCEKLATELLKRKNIDVYLPLRTVIRVYGRQKRKRFLPLIPAYIFVKIKKAEYVRVLETEKIMGIIKFCGEPMAIPEQEINILKRVVGDISLDVELTPNAVLTPGDRVEVIGGSLTGLNGVLKEMRGNHKVVVELETLGYTLTITMNKNMVSPLS